MENKFSPSMAIGTLFILMGVIYLLCNLGIIPALWEPVFISWQMFFIILGIIGLLRHKFILGTILTIFGIVFIMPKVGDAAGFYYPSDTVNKIIWAILNILFGLFLLSRRHRFHKFSSKNCLHSQSQTSINEGVIDYNIVMNGEDEIYLGPEFHGGKINTVMGGMKLDLRKTHLPEGETRLKISSVMGGVTLLIPEDWCIEMHNDSFLGGFTDERPSRGAYVDRKLIIEADFVMGGGTIEC